MTGRWLLMILGIGIVAGIVADLVTHPPPTKLFEGCDQLAASRFGEPCEKWPAEIRRHGEKHYILARNPENPHNNGRRWRRIEPEQALEWINLRSAPL